MAICFNKGASEILRDEELGQLVLEFKKQLPKEFTGDVFVHLSAKPRGRNEVEILNDYIEQGEQPPRMWAQDAVLSAKLKAPSCAATSPAFY